MPNGKFEWISCNPFIFNVGKKSISNSELNICKVFAQICQIRS